MSAHSLRRRLPRVAAVAVAFLAGATAASFTVDWLQARDSTYAFLRLFNEVLLLVRNNYVEEVQVPGLMRGAYDGLLSALDPESEYLTQEQFQRLNEVPGPGTGDVGLDLSRRGGYLAVVSAEPGSPAAQAGLRPGTRIRRINGRSTREMTLTEAALTLRGPVASEVVLQRFPDPGGAEEILTLQRGRWHPAAPDARRSGDAVVLRLPSLRPGTASEARGVLAGTRGEGLPVLLDLRGTSRGDYAESARVAGLFLAPTQAGVLRSRSGEEQVLEVEAQVDPPWSLLGVLVDGGTAGAAEMLAEALRSQGGAPLAGQRTFGRATLQEYIPLEDGGLLRLSVARCHGPGGDTWDGTGLLPDTEIAAGAGEEEDGILRRALEALEGSRDAG